jgi:predicted solute-binding protein
MDPGVMARHIQLYVNEYTRALDESAVERMVSWATDEGIFPAAPGSPAMFV